MSPRRRRASLSVDAVLDDFVSDRLLPAATLDGDAFWQGVADLTAEFAPRIRAALARRDDLQAEIDAWHTLHPGPIEDVSAYAQFLRAIGYLEPVPTSAPITTEGVDDEIATVAGPQLVVPLTNARFAANAANARWGSLYDALYGTDVIPLDGDLARGDGYNHVRGAAVIAWGRDFLDEAIPLEGASHHDVDEYLVDDGQLYARGDSAVHPLVEPAKFVGYRGDPEHPSSVILRNHGLHIELRIDATQSVGARDRAGVHDIVLESALTAIMDLEDSVAAVDAADKVVAYDTWLSLMLGTLEATVQKDGRTFTRRLARDVRFTRADGATGCLDGRALLFVRHTGHSMFSDAVLDADGAPIPEGLLDAIITVAAAIPDLGRITDGPRNSGHGSVYVVKPKLHGPAEVTLTVDMFAAIERTLQLPPRTIKIGIMDEERRTTVNLAACIAAAPDRVVFINTGFLDRTGDEIHTSSAAGPFPRKAQLRADPFIAAYETNNVSVGLRDGFSGRAQIGKGMWAMTDRMAAMVAQKGGQLIAGATTAWVPSPTAATLHATHYHRIDVRAHQRALLANGAPSRDALLTPPVATSVPAPSDRIAELDDNVQSILGYVVRWVDQGIGCSKVPDLSDVALMEDRATLRISSQLLGNWLRHRLISNSDVIASLDRIAPRVDLQNATDPVYRSLRDSHDPSLAYQAARDLIQLAPSQPNGYTEPILHAYRRRAKESS